MSAKLKHDTREGFIHPRRLLAVRLLLLGAAGVACYLAWVSFSGSSAVGCGPASGCGQVLHSRWAYWFGVPVSVFALATYAILLGATFRLGARLPPETQAKAWRVLILGAVVMMLAAMWFVLLQVLVIKSLCLFCMAAQGCGLLASLLLLWAAPIRPAPEIEWQRAKQVCVPPGLARRLMVLAALPVVVLAAGQLAHRPPSYLVITFGGKLEFDLAEVPLIGSPMMTNLMVSLYDYTCHSCREMHWLLMDAWKPFSNQLAIVSLPMPLCRDCNPLMPSTLPIHSNACEYARAGLAVWRADRKKLHEFDDWVYKHYFAPPLTQAWAYASQLVGSNNFARALNDPWIEQQLQRGIAIYATNLFTLNAGDMPQLMIGTNVYFGTISDSNRFRQVIAEGLKLKPGS